MTSDGVPVRRLVIAGVAAALVAASCARRPATTAGRPGEGESGGSVAVRVDNRSGFSLRVYVASETGQKERLGTMDSYGSARFVLPRGVTVSSSEVQMVAEPTGTRRVFTSQPVLINPGDLVDWRILNERGRSTVTVRSGGAPDTASADGERSPPADRAR